MGIGFLDFWMFQILMWDGVPKKLDGICGNTRSNDAPPHHRHDLRNPMASARNAVAIIGSPAGTKGVRASATTIAAMESSRLDIEVKRGQTKPRKAAGTAASSPHAAGFPIALAPKAPTNVKRFQKENTPIPVS